MRILSAATARWVGVTGITIAGILTLIASGGGNGGAGPGVVVPASGSVLYVLGQFSSSVLSYNNANTVGGSTAADRTLSGASTTLNGPRALTVDMPRNRLYIASTANNAIVVFNGARSVTGDVVPNRTITSSGAPTPLMSPGALYLDVANDRLYVASSGNNAILIYDGASSLNGDVAPNRVLSGVATTLNAPAGLFVDVTRDRLYVANGDNRILVFANAGSAAGNLAPAAAVGGSNTTLNGPGQIFVDALADRLYVANSGAASILVFDDASTRSGNVAPDRMLAGAATQLNQPRSVFVDLGTDTLYVVNAGTNTLLAFNAASSATDNTGPSRVLTLPAGTTPYGVFVDVTPIVLAGTAALDGYIAWDGVFSYSAVANGGGPRAGDDESFLAGTRARQFFSFDLANFPIGLNVNSARLRLYQAAITGDPYTDLGVGANVVVDHVVYGTSLDGNAADFENFAAAGIGVLSNSATMEYKTLDVTARVAADLASNRQRSQYRLKFSPLEINADFNSDYAQFADAEDSLAVNRPPQLVVTVEP